MMMLISKAHPHDYTRRSILGLLHDTPTKLDEFYVH